MADATQLNKSYFNDEASKYESKHEKSLRQLSEAIQKRLDLIGADWIKDDDDDDDNDGEDATTTTSSSRQVRLLDYACGTGMISRTLAPYTTQCVGVDLSENMVDAYNNMAKNQGLGEDEMRAVVGDLAVVDDPRPASLAGPAFFDFDVAAVGGGLHHFEHPGLAVARIAERLRPGGVFFIWDFVTHEVNPEHAHKGVTHHGFSEVQVRKMFDEAGLGKNFAMEELGSGVVFGHGTDGKEPLKRQAFLARGQKA